MLRVFGFAKVNAVARGHTRDLRVLWALEEIGMPYEIVGLDHPNHDLDAPAYRAVNPFGQIPAIDDDGVLVTESGAIVLYLGRKSGTLVPRDLAGEAQVLRWSIAALNTVEMPLLAGWFTDISGGKGTKPSDAFRGWAIMRLGQLDGWLANREFVATDEFSAADILMSHVLEAGTEDDVIAPYANVLAYRTRCTDRPAWKRTLSAYCARVEAA